MVFSILCIIYIYIYIYIYTHLTCMYFIDLVKNAKLIEEKLIFGYTIGFVMKQIVYVYDLYVNRLKI